MVLTGDGGDEIFGGYNRYYNLERIWNISKILPRAIVKKIFYLINKIPLKYVSKIMDLIFLFSFTKNKIIQPITKFQKISYGFENSNYLKEFFDNVTKENWVDKKIFQKNKKNEFFNFEKKYKILSKNKNSYNINDLIKLDQRISLSDDMLCKVDRATMSFGLEARVPFLDKEIYNYMYGLPKKYNKLKHKKNIKKNYR